MAAMLAAFAAPAWAQSKECNDENKAAWYDTFLKNYKGEPPQQKIAYDAAKLYLSSCPEDPADKIAEFMKNKFVGPYEAMMKGTSLKKDFEEAVKAKKYADQMRLGKEIIATEPDNSNVYILLGVAGLGDEALLSESGQYARKAIEMIEAGKPPAPLASKDQALAFLNYTIAKSLLKSNPTEAIPYYLKAARLESDLKKTWQLYYDIASAYGEGPRAKLTNDYKPFVGQTETPESKLILANLNQIIDRQIDALARAAALADTTSKTGIMSELSDLYEYRNKSKTGLDQLVASVLTKPLPDVPTPLTTLPTTPGTSGTPANGAAPTGNTGGAKTNGTTGTSTTGQKTTGTTTASGSGAAKPAATPTPSTKKPLNHRRG
jgi:hypothetical protein